MKELETFFFEVLPSSLVNGVNTCRLQEIATVKMGRLFCMPFDHLNIQLMSCC